MKNISKIIALAITLLYIKPVQSQMVGFPSSSIPKHDSTIFYVQSIDDDSKEVKYSVFGLQGSIGSFSLLYAGLELESTMVFAQGFVYRPFKNFQCGLNVQFGQKISSGAIKIPVLGKFYLLKRVAILAGLTPEYWTGNHNDLYKSFNLNLTPGLAFDFNTKNRSGLQLTYDFGLINMSLEEDYNKIHLLVGPLAEIPATEVRHIAITYTYMFHSN
jgi:hypothetical protein